MGRRARRLGIGGTIVGVGLAAAPWAVAATPTKLTAPSLLGLGDAQAAVLGAEVIFNADGELWKTDGTVAGTVLVADLGGVSLSSPRYFLRVGSELIFKADDSTPKLYRTNGTQAGTLFLDNIEIFAAAPLGVSSGAVAYFPTPNSMACRNDGTGPGSYCAGSAGGADFVLAGDDAYFIGTSGAGRELHYWDSSSAALVYDSNPGPPDALNPVLLGVVAGDALLYTASTLYRVSPGGSAQTLATTLVEALRLVSFQAPPTTLIAAGVVFSARESGEGLEPYISDGTMGGTARIADVNPGPGASAPSWIIAFDGEAYFDADDGVHGAELWKTDGTAGGTQLVADVNPGAAPSSPYELVVVGDYLVFYADDGTHGIEPWATDGTSAWLLADVNPGADSSLIAPGASYHAPVALGESVIFAGSDGTLGYFSLPVEPSSSGAGGGGGAAGAGAGGSGGAAAGGGVESGGSAMGGAGGNAPSGGGDGASGGDDGGCSCRAGPGKGSSAWLLAALLAGAALNRGGGRARWRRREGRQPGAQPW